MNKIFYATGNSYKFQTIASYTQQHLPDIEIVQVSGLDIHEMQHTDQNIVAIDKAKQAWNLLQQPVLVDDDGIYFEKYHDFPGVFTKQVYDSLGVDGLYKLVQEGDVATCKVTMVYWYGPESYAIFEGMCPGTIAKKPLFTADPGDPMFIPAGSSKNCAELYASGEWKQYDYRIDAYKKFIAWYQNR